jgi:hypothetical protein
MAVKKKFKIEEPEKVEAEVETIEPVEEEIVEPEVEPVKDSKGIKEYTEEELVVMPREELNQVIADIKAGKAKCKPRIL